MYNFDGMISQLKQSPKSIVFTEGPDPRILDAASRLVKDDFLKPILLGNPEEIQAVAKENGYDITGAVIIDPANYEKMDGRVCSLCGGHP